MEILIIGNGGREHAIAASLAKNSRVSAIYFLTHNGGASGKLINANFPDNSRESVSHFLDEHAVDLVVVGPEQPLSEGLVDFLEERGVKVFGPDQRAARLESSKIFAKEFMLKYGIPTARYERFADYDSALAGLGDFDFPVVVKADGLCAGKGVIICQNREEAEQALRTMFVDKKFGDQAAQVVLEQFLSGFEASLLCFVSGTKIYPFDTAMDYKKIYEGDRGPNTGGVGMISPNPYWNADLERQSEQILRRIETGLAAEDLGFSGILFIGYLVEHGQLYVLEFNARFGDPETEALLPRLQSDLLENILQSIEGKAVELDFADNVAMATILVSEGYPGAYEKNKLITGLDQVDPEILVFHNGTKNVDGQIFSNGGRVLSVVAVKNSLAEAHNAVYQNIESLNFDNMSYRKDIGLLNGVDRTRDS